LWYWIWRDFVICFTFILLGHVTQDSRTVYSNKTGVDFCGVLFQVVSFVTSCGTHFSVFCNLLQFCGDISPNPSPSVVKYPCGTCSKTVTSKQQGIECSRCEQWYHTLCVWIWQLLNIMLLVKMLTAFGTVQIMFLPSIIFLIL